MAPSMELHSTWPGTGRASRSILPLSPVWPMPLARLWRNLVKTLALVYLVISCVTLSVPKAPQPLAWTTRFGIRSRFWWASPHFSPSFCCGGGYGHACCVALGRAPRRSVHYVSGALGRAPCIHARLHLLATNPGEKCGLDVGLEQDQQDGGIEDGGVDETAVRPEAPRGIQGMQVGMPVPGTPRPSGWRQWRREGRRFPDLPGGMRRGPSRRTG